MPTVLTVTFMCIKIATVLTVSFPFYPTPIAPPTQKERRREYLQWWPKAHPSDFPPLFLAALYEAPQTVQTGCLSGARGLLLFKASVSEGFPSLQFHFNCSLGQGPVPKALRSIFDPQNVRVFEAFYLFPVLYLFKFGEPKKRPSKIGFQKLRPSKIGVPKKRPSKIGFPKIRPSKIGSQKLRPSKIGGSKIRPSKLGVQKLRPSKIGGSKFPGPLWSRPRFPD